MRVLSSINTILKKPKAYYFNGELILPTDREFYQPGILTATLRALRVHND